MSISINRKDNSLKICIAPGLLTSIFFYEKKAKRAAGSMRKDYNCMNGQD